LLILFDLTFVTIKRWLLFIQISYINSSNNCDSVWFWWIESRCRFLVRSSPSLRLAFEVWFFFLRFSKRV
jgi:hypothetical protein